MEQIHKELLRSGSKFLVVETVLNHPVPTIENIADAAHLSRPTVRKYLTELEQEGQVQQICCGNAKIFLPLIGGESVDS